jgi:ribonuclease P protein component
MARKWALTKRAQYLTVYKSGKAWVDNFIVIKALPNELEFSRYGFSVAKEIGRQWFVIEYAVCSKRLLA